MAKLCANLSFLFVEEPFLQRYIAAKNAGFKAVETAFPFGFTQEQVVSAKQAAGVEQILINVYTGDTTKGELGFAAIPGKENEFQASIQTTIAYAKALGVKKIHVMSGILPGDSTKENDEVYEKNLRYATSVFEKENITGVIEPINKYSFANYYMNSYDKALNVVKSINSPNLKIMVDIFHLQLIQGNLKNTLKEVSKYIGHMQVAQAPDRNEPNTNGEINYRYVFDLIKNSDYHDWVGLEYKPLEDTVKGLAWIKEFELSL